MTAAVVICAAVILAVTCGLAAVWYAERPARGRHARAAAAVPEPAQLPAAGRLPMLPDEPREWWGVPPPQPYVVEVITGPGTRIAQTSELVLNVLGRVRDTFRDLPPTDATFTPAGADDTRADLPPVTRGPAMSRAELIERYLP